MSIFLPELIPLISQYLCNRDIYRLMGTCKALYSAVSPMFYHRMSLSKREHRRFLRYTESARIDGSTIGDFVKELELRKRSFNEPEYLDDEEFHRLMKNLPQLRKLVLNSPVSYDYYLPALKSLPLCYLPHIEEISITKRTAHLEKIIHDHIAINYKYKDRIRTLRLFHILSGEGDFIIIEKLPEFKNLNHLYICNTIFPMEFFSLLNRLKNLITFESDGVIDMRFIKEIEINNNLTSLQFSAKHFKAQNINTIMQSYPNLRRIDWNILEVCFLQTLSSLDDKRISDFFQYLNRMNKVSIRSSQMFNTTHELHPPTRDSVLLQLIQSTCKQISRFNLNLQLTPSWSERSNFAFEIYYKNVNLTCTCLPNIFTHPSWVDSINFSTLNTIIITIDDEIEGNFDFLDRLMESIKNNSRLPVLIKHVRRRFLFCSKPSSMPENVMKDVLALRKFYIKNQDTQDLRINYGFIKGMTLSGDRLRALGKMYPDVKELIFAKCRFENQERSKCYHIDLSQFQDLHEFTFDLDSCLSVRNSKRPFYIMFIRTDSPQSVIYFHANRTGGSCIELQKDFSEFSIPDSAYVFKFFYVRIRRLAYKKLHTVYQLGGI